VRLETERLVLREWRDADKRLYADIIGDPQVRRFFPSVGSYADAEAGIERARLRLKEHGFGFLALERKADGQFLGMLGMAPFEDAMRNAIPGNPRVEIGWQLGKDFWGQGYAPEAARAVLDFGWRVAKLPEIVAITSWHNQPSRRVMEKIGMTYDNRGDFEHPNIREGHRLRLHVLYRALNPLS
jgi:RimJ/RimL family protein N-acetyltransferase